MVSSPHTPAASVFCDKARVVRFFIATGSLSTWGGNHFRESSSAIAVCCSGLADLPVDAPSPYSATASESPV